MKRVQCITPCLVGQGGVFDRELERVVEAADFLHDLGDAIDALELFPQRSCLFAQLV